jgi:hypothetical protein
MPCTRSLPAIFARFGTDLRRGCGEEPDWPFLTVTAGETAFSQCRLNGALASNVRGLRHVRDYGALIARNNAKISQHFCKEHFFPCSIVPYLVKNAVVV